MKLSQEEIAEELASLQKIVRSLRRRRRELQSQEAIQGISSDPKIVMEIEDITVHIREHEEEIARFETIAAAEHVPVEVIEYHAILAQEWDQSVGHLKLAQRARLDWTRVRLGISLERAREMEYAVGHR